MALIPCILRSSSSIQSKRTTTLATEFCWDRLSSHLLDKWKVPKMVDPQNHGLQILNIDKYRISSILDNFGYSHDDTFL